MNANPEFAYHAPLYFKQWFNTMKTHTFEKLTCAIFPNKVAGEFRLRDTALVVLLAFIVHCR